MTLRGLYAITPDIPDRAELLERVLRAVDGGVALLQYRCKSLPLWHRHEEAKMFALLCRSKRVPFIVNDSVEIALSSHADGVHLGHDDGDIVEARERMAGKLLGISCYASFDYARAAIDAGADYVAFGSVFPSPTKPGAPCGTHGLLVIPGRPPDLTALGPGCAFAPRCTYAQDMCTRAVPELKPVDPGRTTAVAAPEKRPVQSVV